MTKSARFEQARGIAGGVWPTMWWTRVRSATHAGLQCMYFTEFVVTSSRYPSPEYPRWNQGPTVIGTEGVVVLATL